MSFVLTIVMIVAVVTVMGYQLRAAAKSGRTPDPVRGDGADPLAVAGASWPGWAPIGWAPFGWAPFGWWPPGLDPYVGPSESSAEPTPIGPGATAPTVPRPRRSSSTNRT